MSGGQTLQRAWDRQRLQVRVLALVCFGMLVPLFALGLSTRQVVKRLEQRVLDERELLAGSVAAHVAELVGSELELLQDVPAARNFDLTDDNPEPERQALREAQKRRHTLFDEVLLVDRGGKVLHSEPAKVLALAEVAPAVREAFETGRPVVTGLLGRPGGVRRLYALLPVKSWQGETVGLIAGAINPEGPNLRSVLSSYRLARGESIDLVDSSGTVVGTTDPSRLYAASDHAHFVASLIRDRRSVSGPCHSCHGAALDVRVQEVAAFAPMSVAPWAVSVRQQETLVFGAAQRLFTGLTAAAVLFILVALGFAVGAARSVTRPLATLTREAERLAAGALAEPLPELGSDEVGRLGTALEHMRVALQRSLDGAERANAELEERVEQRTAELQSLYKDLQEREEARARLLRKVITAQEDERRRLARDLHDETTQSLAALVMQIQAALAAPAGEAGPRLKEALDLAVRALGDVHRIIVDLRPSVLDDLGLWSAIAWYSDRVLRKQGIAVRCESGCVEHERLPPETRVALFRAVQEALTNIAKHAAADAVLIQCDVRDGMLTIEIEDDGKGFDAAALAAPGEGGHGWGLLGIRERMEIIGGSARIDSSPGQGTHLVLSVPMPQRQEARA